MENSIQNNCFLIYLIVCLNISLNFANNYQNINKTEKVNELSVKPICLIEGDIVCPHDYDEAQGEAQFYLASIDKNKIWLMRSIPVFIDQAYTGTESALIKDAMADLEGQTCVKFKHLDSQPTDGDYVWIRAIQGCYSSVGRATGKQDLSLTSDCLNKGKGTVIHELIHALGIFHEHTRPDRDTYISIEYANILPGYESNFKMRPKDISDLLGEPYDYYSIMHYGIYDFSIDANTRPTIDVLDKTIDVKEVGQRAKVSTLDKTKLDKLYRCDIKQCPEPTSPSGGSFNGNDYSVGAFITFDCNSEYTLVGSKDRFCRFDGRWSGRDVQCLDKPLHYCNFETTGSEMCSWSPTTDTDFDWVRRSGATPQTDTGPIDDFTYETSRGHYIYMETSPPERRGDKAKIMSPELTSNSGVVCISFAHYMWGQKLGTLGLYLSQTSVQLIWEESGNQGPNWKQTKLLFKPKASQVFRLIFEGIVGLKSFSDIALDEVLVIECTEEEGLKQGFKLIKS